VPPEQLRQLSIEFEALWVFVGTGVSRFQLPLAIALIR